MTRFTILRAIRGMNTRDPLTGHDVLNAPLLEIFTSRLRPVVPDIRVEVENLNRKDIGDLSRDPEVAAIAPIMPTKLIAPFDGPQAMAAEPAWGISAVLADRSPFDGTNVSVAVLDTGIDAGHPAFAGVSLVQKDFTGSGNGDVQGHGTHCAGTIFGRDIGAQRIGIARGVTTGLIGKVLANDGSGTSDWIFRAINWAFEEGARVISMSLGFDFVGMVKRLTQNGWPQEAATSAVLEAYRGNLRMFDRLMALAHARAAFDQGAVVVAAAGNESNRPTFEVAASLPAAAEGIIAVGALDRSNNNLLNLAPFSNTLPQLTAPGVGIVSARAGGGLRVLSGTSMATPHVAGVAALWWQALANTPVPLNAQLVESKLRTTARSEPIAATVDIADRGVGIVTAPV